jgi:hypothetical protein
MRTGCLLCGVVVSVLATGPIGRGFKPDRGDGFLRKIKICSTPCFGSEVKPEAPHRKILHVKITRKCERSTHSSYLLPDVAGEIVREIWWTSQEFSSAGISPWFSHAHISPGGRSSETYSHPIDIINHTITYSGFSIHDGTLLHSKSQYTTVKHSQQLL